MKRILSTIVIGALASLSAGAQTAKQAEAESKLAIDGYAPRIHGTIRGKYEYEPDLDASRFEVRNARVSVEGKLLYSASYKAEIDLSDEGNIKMLDAYGSINPFKGFEATLGQMRVPFSIDAHRSPHVQYFANRSFIAKQVGNVRDVGMMLSYTFDAPFRMVLQGGMFNGSGLTAQKSAWHSDLNYSAKLQLFPVDGWNVTASVQRSRCGGDSIHYTSLDLGTYYDKGGWHIEAEYLRKTYSDDLFGDVNAVDAFVAYSHPLRKCFFNRISYLARYDYMDDHTDGTKGFASNGKLAVSDYARHRATAGVTLQMKNKMFTSELRLNYEKYFYKSGGTPKESEQDKFVAEYMIHF